MELEIIIAILLILMTAFMFAPLGLGGGVLYVPIFLFLLEWDIQPSLVASLILVWAVSIGSRAAHEKGGYVVASVGKMGTNAALMGAVFGAVLAAIFIKQLGDMSIKISATFLLIWVLYSTIKKLTSELNGNGNGDYQPPEVEGKVLNIYRAGCFGGGAASGLLGIGGGAIFVTLHRSTLKYKQHQAAGTSYIIESWMVPMAILTHLVIDRSGIALIETLGIYLLLICILVAGTAWVGAKVAIKMLPQRVLTYPFIIAVFVSLVRYLIDIKDMILLG
ncbi:MAG TPA: hypothetical protein EYN58_07445 [Candidatus Poseidoniales archaeon]|nr:MAG: hypothetical protein CXX81_29320 [Euryarchaeota archaeon]HHZ74987.1 hypothetical protein [Candidatus Poseidoniales archaeon]PXY77815.1 MAG: hypothetical protein CXX81_10940 [Euryarchaeota archaeon]PXY78591.1 MAG: hypothetical protein CXX81_06950 [Euryarchaeota archaeon]HIA25418.1 hypothetical protein [Candidatus Poseidoniales archaeon]